MIWLWHGGPSGHSAAVMLALAEKGLAFESHAIDLAAFEQHRPDFLAINPSGQVPVLEHDGLRLTESFFILLYLDDVFPHPPLGGSDPRTRYQVQRWGKYLETHIAPNLAIAANPGALEAAHAGFERLPPERRALWLRAAQGFTDDEVAVAREAVARAAARIEAALGDAPWLAGDDYTLADIALFPHVLRIAPPAGDRLANWLDRMRARPRVRAMFGEARLDTFSTMGPELCRWG